MKVTTRPAERSSVVLEVEFPADQVRNQVAESVRHLARRTKVPGFRPGKVPRPLLERALGVRRDDPDAENPIYDDAKEHLFERSVLDAVREKDLDVLQIPDPEWTSFAEDAGATYLVTLPIRPDVKLGAYTDYPVPDHDRRDKRRIGRQGHRAAPGPAGIAGAGRGQGSCHRRLRRDPLHRFAATASRLTVPRLNECR